MSLVSEDHLLAAISHYFPPSEQSPGILTGRTDDCAVVKAEEPVCISTDLFIEDVHFRRRYFEPGDIGWKALAVNLSDLAACGARPVGFSLGLALPPDADLNLIHGLFEGMAELALLTDTPLTGGDLSRGQSLVLCITVFGEASHPLLRARAKPGDILFIVGRAGMARTGLLRLEAEGRSAIKNSPHCCAAHLRPIPRLDEGRTLHAFAMDHPEARIGLMDLSDGLARDVPRLIGLTPSGCSRIPKNAPGADIELPEPHPEVVRYCAANELDVSRHCLLGGEDYALIGTCAPDSFNALKQTLPELGNLGTVGGAPSLRYKGKPVKPGFDHFA